MLYQKTYITRDGGSTFMIIPHGASMYPVKRMSDLRRDPSTFFLLLVS